MNHWNLFKEAWRIFWRNSALWVFGLLAALGGGSNLRYNFNFNFGVNQNLDQFNRSFGQNWQQMLDMTRTLINQVFSNQTFGVIVAIGIVWMIFAFLLATFADGALMSMVNTISGGQKLSVGDGFRAGARRFLPLLAVRFILALPTLTLAILVAIVTSQTILTPQSDGGSQQFFIRMVGAIAGLGLLIFIAALLMMGIGISAERAVVIDELPIGPSLVKGWKFLWSKLGDYFIIVVLFIGVAIVVSIAFACLLAPIAGLGALSTFDNNGTWNFTRVMAFTGPTILVSVLLGLIFGTLVNVFTSSVWTLAYREWRSNELPASPRNDFE